MAMVILTMLYRLNEQPLRLDTPLLSARIVTLHGHCPQLFCWKAKPKIIPLKSPVEWYLPRYYKSVQVSIWVDWTKRVIDRSNDHKRPANLYIGVRYQISYTLSPR